MPPLQVHRPRTVDEAVTLRTELPDALYVAGGTDLLVNLKHRLHAPQHLVSLAAVEGLGGIVVDATGGLRIGAATSLHAVATSEPLRTAVPALAESAGLVAAPQHRHMGTLGGNVMLDTRCLFYNQTEAWRQALGYCLKKDGTHCHVIGSTRSCVAARSGDTVPVLVALDATLELATPEGEVTLSLSDALAKDGRFEQRLALDPRALLHTVVLPPPAPGHRSVYRKVRARNAVDFPQLGLAVVADLAPDGVCRALTVVVGAVLPQPRRLKGMERAVGTRLEDAVIEELAELAYKQTKPLVNIHGDRDWRRHLARVELRRGLQALRASATAAT